MCPESETESSTRQIKSPGHFIFLVLDPTTGCCTIFDAMNPDEQSKFDSSYFDTDVLRMTIQLISDYVNKSFKRKWRTVQLKKIGLQRVQGSILMSQKKPRKETLLFFLY